MTPLISVIIPCYNRANLVGQAIESILQQTYSHHEIIIVNDGSSDNLTEALEPYRDKIKFIDKKHNEGVSAARNSGISIAKGEFISFLDSDDLWLPDKSQLHLNILLDNNKCGMAVGACEYVDINNSLVLNKTSPLETISYKDLCIYTAIPGSTSNVLIRKSILDEVGYFDPTLHVAEDRDLWMRISSCSEVCSTPVSTVQIRIHDGERQNRSFELKFTNRKTINNRIKNKHLKRKADAWLYFCEYNNSSEYTLIKSLNCLVSSFLKYPFKIHPKLCRIRPILSLLRRGKLRP